MKYFSISNILLILYLISLSETLIENEKSQQFRAVWVSPWGGDSDLITYKSKQDFINKMTYILDLMKEYNLNTIIYHVRTHNDALYKSNINPVSRYFESVNFSEFNPLEWMIDESHKRGIDFHAWMNPYRIKSGNSTSLEDIISLYKDYNNPANDKRCILNGSDSIVLDPGLEKVRSHIEDTVVEFLNKFDVDAIHFDDYFYFNMGAGGKTEGEITILDEPDQITYEEYIDNHTDCKYNKSNANDKANWRRDQIDILIYELKIIIDNHNKINNKNVQFGISPTGIYRNGDGKVSYDSEGNAITTGSTTNGQEHYASYLFCDTLKWINKEWISYILPQSYWARDHPLAKYENVMEWWNKVVENKNVNLFSGIGLYQADLSSNTHGWKNDENELYEQLIYSSQGKNIHGISIYNFHTLRALKDGMETYSAKQIKNGKEALKIKIPPNEIKSFKKIILDEPKNFKIENGILYFEKVEGAKFYIIYKSENEISFNSEEIVEIFGDNNNNVSWKDNNIGNYNYGVRALSYSNTLGKGVSINNNKNNEDKSNSGKYLSLGIFTLIALLLILFE